MRIINSYADILNNRNKLNRVVMCFVLSLIFIINISLEPFAFFKTQPIIQAVNGPFTLSTDNSYSISVSSESKLTSAIADCVYNSKENLSDIGVLSDTYDTNRKTIYLTSDISLTNDLTITSDCHIDLEGHTIDLRGYNIIIRHMYHGSTVITNGTVTSSVRSIEGNPNISNIHVQTPNSVFLSDCDLEYVTLHDISSDTASLLIYAMQMVKAVLTDNSHSSDIYSLISNIENTSLHSHYCTLHTTPGDYACCFIKDDIDLPTYLCNYSDIVFSYTPDQNLASVISPNGNILSGTTSVTGNLGVTIEYNGSIVTRDFTVHYISSSDTSAFSQAAIIMFADEFIKYKGRDVEDPNKYALNPQIMLPVSNSFSEKNLYYSAYDEDDLLLDSTKPGDTEHERSLFEDHTDDNYILFTGGTSSVRLDVFTYESAQVTASASFNISADGGTAINTDATVALALIRAIYNGQIDILDDPNGYNSYSVRSLTTDSADFPDSAYYTSQGITGITYELTSDFDNTYELGTLPYYDYSLYVTDSGEPTTLQAIYLRATVHFMHANETNACEINIPIVYKPQDGGSNIDYFLPYFYEFRKTFNQRTAGYTFNDFDMPVSYGSSVPLLAFNLTSEPASYTIGNNTYTINDTITMTLHYGNNQTADKNTVLSWTASDWDRIAPYQSAHWTFSIDPLKVPDENVTVTLEYIYKSDINNTANITNQLKPADRGWFQTFKLDEETSTYSKVYTTSFTLPGLIQKDSNGMPNQELYKLIYQTYNPYKADDYNAVTSYITTDQVQDMPYQNERAAYIDNNPVTGTNPDTQNDITTLTIINKNSSEYDLQGIQYLKGVKRLNLYNSYIVESDIENYISNMTWLTYLNLGKAQASTSSSVPSYYWMDNRNTGDQAGINSLSKLSNVKELHIEYNTIFRYDFLSSMSSLEKAYVYGSTNFTHSYIGISFIDNILATVYADLYGSEGIISSLSTFNSLATNGVSIYNVNSTDIFVPLSGSDNDILAIENIEYQKRIPIGTDISEVYSTLSTDPDDYGITDHGYAQYSFNNNRVGPHEIAYSYSNDPTTATYFTVSYTYHIITGLFLSVKDNEITIDFTFPVERF